METQTMTSFNETMRRRTKVFSDAEFFSKICIVVEECDESVFWLEYLTETGILQETETKSIKKEAEELLFIFSSVKKKLKDKRNNP